MNSSERPTDNHEFKPAIDVKKLTGDSEKQESLMEDSSYYTFSIRRHGRYERGDNVPTQRGQLTKETFPEVREVAKQWVDSLPEDVEVHIITSPTFMPAEGPQGDKIYPKRAKATGSIYGAELRERFGEGHGYLSYESLSERGKEVRDKAGTGLDIKSQRELDQRLGDIFEMTTKEQSERVPDFFKQLSKDYGGLTPDFWQDFIKGNLPEELNNKYLAAGGETALQKTKNAIDVIESTLAKPHDAKKQVALLVSHEEVIGSMVYQLTEFAKSEDLLNDSQIEQLESTRISYNQGFDLHVKGETASVNINGVVFEVDLKKFGEYVEEKLKQEQSNN